MSTESQASVAPEVALEAAAPIQYYYVQGKTGPRFKISELAAHQSELLKGLISNLVYTAAEAEKNEPLPLDNMPGEIVEKVVAWCEQHQGEPKPVDDDSVPKRVTIPEWDQKFLDALDNRELFNLIVAANYLDIQQLLNYGCKIVALMGKGKSPEEMMQIYAIPTDEQDDAEEDERQKLKDAAKIVTEERGDVPEKL